MEQRTCINVILPLRLEWEPCYYVCGDIRIGDRVKVTFAHREYSGVVSEVGTTPDIDPSKILQVISVERDMERILPQEIALWRSVAEYYMCTVGEVYKAAYPYGKVHIEEAKAKALRRAEEREEDRKRRSIRSLEMKIGRLQARHERKTAQAEKASRDSTREKYLSEAETIADEICRIREEMEVLEKGTATAQVEIKENRAEECKVMLSEAQLAAYWGIREAFAAGKPVLLHGVTGSGKTEIYIRLAYDAMEQGKDVLYLVPEITLSRQLEDRLRSHFGDMLSVFHSGETAVSRRETADRLRKDRDGGRIVLGTRSSLFLPFGNLGLIIVDEEHDSSYKQDSPAPRYNGRDTALMLSKIQGCGIVLGSATPSLEEIYNCRSGRHILVGLDRRYYDSEDSGIEIIDTRAERRKRGMIGSFSRILIDHISAALSRGEQVAVLRSRRAWAPVLQCDRCGTIVKCPHCNVSLSYHKTGKNSPDGTQEGIMICHYCGYATAYTGRCPACTGSLTSLGSGTQKIEEEAAALFPNARIARLDSDTAQNKSFETKTIREFAKGDIDILIGTQIVTKGFDFSNLTLVAVIAADTLLGMQDFRADEKAVQLLEQFRGRCGRRGRKGMFLIQTSQPEHPVYRRMMNGESASLNLSLLEERRDFLFPPYTRIVEIDIRDICEDRAERMAKELCARLRRVLETDEDRQAFQTVTGPYAPAVDKVADRYIRAVRITLRKDRSLMHRKMLIRNEISAFGKERKYDGHITINVDPS